MSLTLVRNDLLCSCNYIAGQWREGRAGKRLPVSDPATGLVLASVPDSDANDASDAADAAHKAFPAWRASSARDRARLLKRWRALIEAHAEDLAKLISLEQGKPLNEALW